MTQPDFDFTAPTERKPWKRVRETSKATYAIGRQRFTGRRADVLRWLAAMWNRHNASPTSGELASHGASEFLGRSWDWVLLYTRRGLSDLLKTGIVEHVPNGVRRCTRTHSACETWRVRERGSEESR
jgi:hypothetical protein